MEETTVRSVSIPFRGLIVPPKSDILFSWLLAPIYAIFFLLHFYNLFSFFLIIYSLLSAQLDQLTSGSPKPFILPIHFGHPTVHPTKILRPPSSDNFLNEKIDIHPNAMSRKPTFPPLEKTELFLYYANQNGTGKRWFTPVLSWGKNGISIYDFQPK